MTKRETVIRTIQGLPAPCVPYSFDLTSEIKDKLAAHYGVAPREVHRAIGDFMQYVYMDMGHHPVDESHWRDDFGVVWISGDKVRHMGDWGGIASHPLVNPSLTGYRFPDPGLPGRFDDAVRDAADAKDRYVVLHLDGLLDVAWHLRGFEQLMEDLICEGDFAHALLDAALEFNLKAIRSAPACIDGIRFGEDWGQQKGLFMGKKHWDTYLKPRLERMYQAARARGFQVLIHSCGDISSLFPDLIAMGVQAVHPVQPEVMDVRAIKAQYGNRVTLYGGLGCQSTIPRGTQEEVVREAEHRLALLGAGGRYIFGPAGAIPTDAPLDNVLALVGFAKQMNGRDYDNH